MKKQQFVDDQEQINVLLSISDEFYCKHVISATLFFVVKWGFYLFPGNSKSEKKDYLSVNQNSLSVFDLTEREFCLSDLEFPGNR